MQSAGDGRQIAPEPRAHRERALSGRHGQRGRRTRCGMRLCARISRRRLQQRSLRCRRRHVTAGRNESLGRRGRDGRYVPRRAQRERTVGALRAAKELRAGRGGQHRKPNAGRQNELAPPAGPRPPDAHRPRFSTEIAANSSHWRAVWHHCRGCARRNRPPTPPARIAAIRRRNTSRLRAD